jgi:hypothetical protein
MRFLLPFALFLSAFIQTALYFWVYIVMGVK